MGFGDAVIQEEEERYPLIDAPSVDDLDDMKGKEDDDDELNAPQTPSPTPGLLASGSSMLSLILDLFSMNLTN